VRIVVDSREGYFQIGVDSAMFILVIIAIAILLVVPESRALIDTFFAQAELSIIANLPIFCVGFLCTLIASGVSCIAPRFRRREKPTYRVIRVEVRDNL
jgi:hypothetical protein